MYRAWRRPQVQSVGEHFPKGVMKVPASWAVEHTFPLHVVTGWQVSTTTLVMPFVVESTLRQSPVSGDGAHNAAAGLGSTADATAPTPTAKDAATTHCITRLNIVTSSTDRAGRSGRSRRGRSPAGAGGYALARNASTSGSYAGPAAPCGIERGTAMRRIIVVANRTLGGRRLLEEVGRRMKAGDCRIHVVVPITHPMGSFSEASCMAEAQRALDEGTRRIRQLDPTGSIDVSGEVGDANPVYAVQCLINRGETFDEVVVSTLPPGPSRWLKGDVPKRMAKAFPGAFVAHVVDDRQPAAI
jgi:hypothetical protein